MSKAKETAFSVAVNVSVSLSKKDYESLFSNLFFIAEGHSLVGKTWSKAWRTVNQSGYEEKIFKIIPEELKRGRVVA